MRSCDMSCDLFYDVSQEIEEYLHVVNIFSISAPVTNPESYLNFNICKIICDMCVMESNSTHNYLYIFT